MKTLSDVINEIIENGDNPEDFNIEINENTIKVFPKTDKQRIIEWITLLQKAVDDLILGGGL